MRTWPLLSVHQGQQLLPVIPWNLSASYHLSEVATSHTLLHQDFEAVLDYDHTQTCFELHRVAFLCHLEKQLPTAPLIRYDSGSFNSWPATTAIRYFYVPFLKDVQKMIPSGHCVRKVQDCCTIVAMATPCHLTEKTFLELWAARHLDALCWVFSSHFSVFATDSLGDCAMKPVGSFKH